MRRDKDFYPTPSAGTIALLRSEVGPRINGFILEPCVGAGDMAKLLKSHGSVVTNDVDPQWNPDLLEDARFMKTEGFDWIVTNPPFTFGLEILQNLLPQARVGVAFLLRVTFAEPTIDRGPFLQQFPPTKIIHMPRMSFTGNGRTDSAHASWFIWEKTGWQPKLINEWVTKKQMRAFTKEVHDEQVRLLENDQQNSELVQER